MLFVLALISLVTCIHYTPPVGEEMGYGAFEGWMKFFNKTYMTPRQKIHAYKNYIASYKKVEQLQRVPSKTIWGLTKFADMSPKEFKRTMLMNLRDHHPRTHVHVDTDLAAPTKAIDWVAAGKTTPIKNQLQCGSCWAFSATETIETANLITGKLKNPTHESTWLSPQEIVDCDTEMYGCEGGWPFQAMSWVISQGGLDTESSYPYTGVGGTCASASGKIGATIMAYYNITTGEQAMYTALANPTIGPLSIACDASQWSSYSGGLFPPADCEGQIDHAIQLVGYITQMVV